MTTFVRVGDRWISEPPHGLPSWGVVPSGDRWLWWASDGSVRVAAECATEDEAKRAVASEIEEWWT